MPNLETFLTLYTEELTRSVREKPGEYSYPEAEVPTVMGRIRTAIERGNTFGGVNKDSCAIRRLCKRLGIKHTYKAIDAYLRGEYLPGAT